MARPTGPASHHMDAQISHRITEEELALLEQDLFDTAERFARMLIRVRRARVSNREAAVSVTAARERLAVAA